MEFAVSDDHCGLRNAVSAVFADAVWQRCCVHFFRNALDHMPKKHIDLVCMMELRYIPKPRELSADGQNSGGRNP